MTTLWDLTIKGGFALIPLAFISLWGLKIFVEKIILLQQTAQNPEYLFEKVKQAILDHHLDQARSICIKDDSPAARILEKGIVTLNKDLKKTTYFVEKEAEAQVYKLGKGLFRIALFAVAAPLIGTLGSLYGLIIDFMSIAETEADVTIKTFATVLYENLICLFIGVAIGMFAFVSYYFLRTMLKKNIYYLRQTVMEFLELLEKPYWK